MATGYASYPGLKQVTENDAAHDTTVKTIYGGIVDLCRDCHSMTSFISYKRPYTKREVLCCRLANVNKCLQVVSVVSDHFLLALT